MRKLELEEKRYELDKAEREARFALEQQERQLQFEIMKGTLETPMWMTLLGTIYYGVADHISAIQPKQKPVGGYLDADDVFRNRRASLRSVFWWRPALGPSV
ncbi:hypothetical protein H310_05657 [Aphanomyces invadans]|uniref:Uncharacterized protein n=1 Tax=Aphanomyces invadans TaxID=157072 RepID=A0A024UA18_9STRA|nr:hypothetical protein H310_05657 [Aphanomyces invadans]ETW03261.1 hypothetical protein H310_05657 [Aphanomyces invadans]|eukprot:XP_008868645.1 hypothetical protein H310_05657 [Aphanomyces invadans]